MLGIIHYKRKLVTRVMEIILDGIDQHIVTDGLGGANSQLQPLFVRNRQLQLLELVLLRNGIPLQQQALFRFMQSMTIV